MTNNFFQYIFMMLQTVIFYISDVYFLFCRRYYLILRWTNETSHKSFPIQLLDASRTVYFFLLIFLPFPSLSSLSFRLPVLTPRSVSVHAFPPCCHLHARRGPPPHPPRRWTLPRRGLSPRLACIFHCRLTSPSARLLAWS